MIFPGISPFGTTALSQHIPPTRQSSRELASVPWCEGRASPSLQLRGMTAGTNEVRNAIGLSARHRVLPSLGRVSEEFGLKL